MQAYGKRFRFAGYAGALAATVGIAAFGGSLVTASVAMANVPGGVACQPSDGKINGRGSTYQTRAEALFWTGYDNDFCGNTPSSGGDVAGNDMGTYNYAAAGAISGTGSGAGLSAAACRTDAYAGTDLPYNQAQLADLDGPAGVAGSVDPITTPCTTFPATPFPPDSATNGSVFPNASDAQANIMSFPIAGSAESLLINLTAAQCGGHLPAIQLTPAEIEGVLAGDTLNWDTLTGLSACNEPITRVIREDNSGTTAILKGYLQNITTTNVNRTGETCDPGFSWLSYDNASANTTWPGNVTGQPNTNCSPLMMSTSSGGPALITKLESVPGGIGYADLADAVSSTGLITATVQNATDTGFVSPGAGQTANCDFSTLTLPGSDADDAVGLNADDNWGLDNATVNGPPFGSVNHENATDLGSKYPICGLTFELVYTGLSAGPSQSSAIAALTADQRRTLYSFMTYSLSDTAQSQLANDYYAPLPSAWLPLLLSGFQSNF